MPWELFGNANTDFGSFLGTSNQRPLTIKTDNKERMEFGANGGVRINGGAALNLVAIGTDVPGIDYTNQQETVGIDSVSGDLRLQSPNNIFFHTGGADLTVVKPIERMTITKDGNVGIGTSAPASGTKLHVHAGRLRISESDGPGRSGVVELSNGSHTNFVFTDGPSGHLHVRTDSASHHVTLQTGEAQGNVGIGTQPSHKLHVEVKGGEGHQEVRGIHSSVVGAGNGAKLGISSMVTGDGTKVGGQFEGISEGDGSATGVQGVAQGSSSTGVAGSAIGSQHSVGGSFSAFGPNIGGGGGFLGSVGVIGRAMRADGLFTCGVYGTCGGGFGDQNCFAGHFDGKVFVSGILQSPHKQFVIDHPLDPENKTLSHSAVESPESTCLYRGKVNLDADGKATVRLPDYFAALTKEDEATVYLTPMGEEPSPTSYIWEEAHTSLTVFGAAGAEVGYLVLAARDDPAVRLLSQPVEVEKGKGIFERGKLLHPGAFGKPAEAGIAPVQPARVLQNPR